MPSTISSTRAADRLGELAGRGGAAQALGELGGRRADLHPQLLEPARHPDRPALVAEVALDLADDRGRGVRRELHAALGVEAVDRLDQADRADLDQVLERLAAVAEAAGAVLDQRQVQVDERRRGPRRGWRRARPRRGTPRTAPHCVAGWLRPPSGLPAACRRPASCHASMSEAGPQVAGHHGEADGEDAVAGRRPAALVARVVSTCQAKLS